MKVADHNVDEIGMLNKNKVFRLDVARSDFSNSVTSVTSVRVPAAAPFGSSSRLAHPYPFQFPTPQQRTEH